MSGFVMNAVPVLGELAEAGAADTDRVARVEAHARSEIAVAGPDQPAQRVLRAGEQRRRARAGGGMVLSPVAVPPAPHLVDPPLGDPGAELRLVMDDRH